MDIAYLEYVFLIDPVNSFTSLTGFENALQEFFTTKGLEAQVVNAVQGTLSKRVMFITKKQEMPVMDKTPQPVNNLRTPKNLMKKLTKK